MRKEPRRKKDCFFDLATQFLDSKAVDGCSVIWYRRDGWYIWGGTHYEHVGQEAIEQQLLRFLRTRSSNMVRRSNIRNILDLLRILQYRPPHNVPCWLNGARFPDPADLLVLSNGVLDVPSAANGGTSLLPHDPHLFGVTAVDFEYCPTATCGRWLAFLEQLWPLDSTSKETLQEWFAYCLRPDTRQQKILAIIGPRCSGKSTIARVLRELIGSSNVACPSIRSLSGQFGLWGLLDKTLAIVPDATLPRPCPALEELLKSISGEDAMDIHRKGLPPLTGISLPTRLVILSNELPAFHDPSGALDRRLIVLRTQHSFIGVEDQSLTKTLTDELSGILNWALQGWSRLAKRGHFVGFANASDPEHEAILPALPATERIRRIVIEYEQANA